MYSPQILQNTKVFYISYKTNKQMKCSGAIEGPSQSRGLNQIKMAETESLWGVGVGRPSLNETNKLSKRPQNHFWS